MGGNGYGAFSRAVLAAAVLSGALGASGSGAHAQLVISKDPTSNMNLLGRKLRGHGRSGGPQHQGPESFLQHGNLSVFGGAASSIVIAGNVTWSKKTKLTLDANPIYFDARVKVDGKGSLTLTTLEQGDGPNIAFSKKGNIVFANPHSQLIIDALPYKLETNLPDLIADIRTEAGIAFALVGDYDASADGTYSQSPIPATFDYWFEGLGHTI